MVSLRGAVSGFSIGLVSASVGLLASSYVLGRATDAAYWQGVSSILTAIATVVLVFVTALLWVVTDKTAKASERAADAAKEAITLSETTSKRQLRAYVIVTDARIAHFTPPATTAFVAPGAQTYCEIHFANHGQTPAKNVRVTMDARVLSVPEREADFSLQTAPMVSSLTAGPGDPKASHAVIRSMLSPAEYQGILANKSAVFIFGYLEYEDVFGDVRRSEFRLRNLSGVHDGSTSFCALGNNID